MVKSSLITTSLSWLGSSLGLGNKLTLFIAADGSTGADCHESQKLQVKSACTLKANALRFCKSNMRGCIRKNTSSQHCTVFGNACHLLRCLTMALKPTLVTSIAHHCPEKVSYIHRSNICYSMNGKICPKVGGKKPASKGPERLSYFYGDFHRSPLANVPQVAQSSLGLQPRQPVAQPPQRIPYLSRCIGSSGNAWGPRNSPGEQRLMKGAAAPPPMKGGPATPPPPLRNDSRTGLDPAALPWCPELWWLADVVSRNGRGLQIWCPACVVARKCHLMQMCRMVCPSRNS